MYLSILSYLIIWINDGTQASYYFSSKLKLILKISLEQPTNGWERPIFCLISKYTGHVPTLHKVYLE